MHYFITHKQLQRLGLFIGFFAIPFGVFAAGMEISLDDTVLVEQGIVEVSLIVDTAGESWNTFKGTLNYPKDLVELSDIRTANSLVPFWVESPHDTGGSIVFSGIVPGGLNTQNGLILQTYFIPKNSGMATFTLRDQEIFKNDGLGTPVSGLGSHVKTIAVSETDSQKLGAYIISDTRDPEPFKITRSRDPNIFDGAWFITFASQDKGSGIATYRICEGLFSCSDGTSPHLLEKQYKNYRITVTAIDKQGNATRARLFSPLAVIQLIGIIIFGVILIFIIFYRFFIAKRLKHKV